MSHILNTYALELNEAVTYLKSITTPTAVLISGSIVRGNPGPSSDIDMVVLHSQPWIQRVQKKFKDLPFEMFINTPQSLTEFVTTEPKSGRPVMAHMLATGLVLQDTDGWLSSVIAQSKEILKKGPCLTATELNAKKYAAACWVEDALDFKACFWSLDAKMVKMSALNLLVDYQFLADNKFIPRHKEKLEMFLSQYPSYSQMVATVLTDSSLASLDALKNLSLAILGVDGFYEWESLKK